jgi:hypothetical protein
MTLNQNSYETVISYNNQNKINFNNPMGWPILALQKLMKDGRLELKDWFQRDYCWDKKQVVALIHTLLNTPTLLPEIVLVLDGNENNGKYFVADGHQRLRSILIEVLNNTNFIYKSDEIEENTLFHGVKPGSPEWDNFVLKLTTTPIMVKVIKNNLCTSEELDKVKSYVFSKWNNGTGMKDAEKRSGKTSELNKLVIFPLKNIDEDYQRTILKKKEIKHNMFNDFIERLFYHYKNPNAPKDPNKEQFKQLHSSILSDNMGKINQFKKLVESSCKVAFLFKKNNGQFAFDSTSLREMVIFCIGLFQKGELKNFEMFESYLMSLIDKVHTAYIKNDKFKKNKKGQLETVDMDDHNFWYVDYVSTFGSGQDNNFTIRKDFLETNKEVWGKLNNCDKQRDFTVQQKQYMYIQQGKMCHGDKQSGCDYTNGVISISEMEGDHIVEHAEEGMSTIENLQMLCKNCHKDKTSKYMTKQLEVVI